ncbi:Hypothetical_protein [Hexamita inflata]|uniref:Hypothetical_protein n=1 Tax=Hexamita inflata TaxID=28002 RepID=A0AA86NMR6_9EUKA|nr:Hypothetical protein HINF_LOCUS9796 [Hexamita inflata]CAI9922154.1 Hypothetical protein HINF_LOCUS9799 [Hexamita inflata]CAI9978073.1 Hypothetical protein HINF_LOCUS65718 [Hexamita inflata]
MKYLPPMLKQINVSRSPSASDTNPIQKRIHSYPMDSRQMTEYQDGNYSFEVNNNISTDFLVVNKEQTLILRLKAENENMRALLEQAEKQQIYLAFHDENMQRMKNNAGLIKKYINNMKDWINSQ